MIKHRTNIRIRYAETDQMGFVHHSRYALYLEEARMGLLSSIGIDCNKLEKAGVIMPVVEMETRFSSPLYYGDTITVETTISPPWNAKLVFRYKIFNQNNRLVSRAQTSLVFAEKETGQLVRNPDEYLVYFTRAQVEVTS